MKLQCMWIAVFVVVGMPLVSSSVQAAAEADAARQTVRELIDRVAAHEGRQSATGATAEAWTGARPGEPVAVWTTDGETPCALLVPLRDGADEVCGFVELDPSGQNWRWYTAAQAVQTWLSERAARRRIAKETGRPVSGSPDAFRLLALPDHRYYWALQWETAGGQVHTAYLDATDPTQCYLGAAAEAAGLFSAALNAPPDRRWGHRAAPAVSAIPPAPYQQARYPDEYDIVDVPHYFQNTGYNCGPASLQMLFDYWGEAIPQGQVKRAANCTNPYGTYADDLRRAGHFSAISTAIQNPDEHGYEARPYGYATMAVWWSDGAHYDTRYTDLKELVSSDIPVLLLTWFGASHQYGHFRVVKGYSDPLDVFIVHDPYSTMGPDLHFDQAYLVDDLWEYSGRWGITSQPWEFEISAPSSVDPGDEFTVSAEVFYPGAHPFEGQYLATDPQATLRLPAGLIFAVGEDSSQAITGLSASATSGSVSWQVVADDDPGMAVFSIYAAGRISGWCTSYGDYEDDIGGVGWDSVRVEQDPAGTFTDEAPLARTILYPCRPNPSPGQATIRFALPEAQPVRVSVHDATGRQVGVLLEGMAGRGEHVLPWRFSGSSARGHGPRPAGVYYVRLETAHGVLAGEPFVVVR